MTDSKSTRLLVIAAIVLLFLLTCYSRFIVYSEIYHPLFLAAFDKTLFPGDVFVADHFYRHGAYLFYVFLEIIGLFLSWMDPINILFLLFVLNNLFSVWICYQLGRETNYGLGALFFVVALFSPFEFLRGADVSIVYNHVLCGTAFAFPFAVWSALSLLRSRYLSMLVTLFIASALSLKTGFAIGAPIFFVICYQFLALPETRIRISKALAVMSIPLLSLAGFIALGRDDMMGCGLLEIMIEREGNETDILKNVSYIRGRPYYYLLLNCFALYLTSREPAHSRLATVHQLLIAANCLLLVGVVVSIGSAHYEILLPLMLLAWPKLALLPTLLSIAVVCRFISEPNRTPKVTPHWIIVSSFFGLLFCALLNIDLMSSNHQLLRWIFVLAVVVLAIVVVNLNSLNIFQYQVSAASLSVLGVTLFQVAIAGFNAKNIYEEGKEADWHSSFYRTPGSFNQDEWSLAYWLNSQDRDKGLAIYLNIEGGDVEIKQLRRYSTIAMYLTGKPSDVYGSCSRKLLVDKRLAAVDTWIRTGDSFALTQEGLHWVISDKPVDKVLEGRISPLTYESDKFVVGQIR